MTNLWSVSCSSLDLSAAFDPFVRTWLWTSIRLRLPPELENTTLFDIVQNLYSKTTIDIDGHKIQTTAGIRQGGPESPLLFNLYIDFVMRIFMLMQQIMDGISSNSNTAYSLPKRNVELNVAQRLEQPSWIDQDMRMILFYIYSLLLLFKHHCRLLTPFSNAWNLQSIRRKLKQWQRILNTRIMKINLILKVLLHWMGNTSRTLKNCDTLAPKSSTTKTRRGDWEVNFRIESAKNKFSTIESTSKP